MERPRERKERACKEDFRAFLAGMWLGRPHRDTKGNAITIVR